mmetsp:Transcript_12752/g.29937  ORF Transcript_12752/g.29937 Transcript_12752/m.29937 type:complete len:215 (-) Transcript_12752:446-1090(-)
MAALFLSLSSLILDFASLCLASSSSLLCFSSSFLFASSRARAMSASSFALRCAASAAFLRATVSSSACFLWAASSCWALSRASSAALREASNSALRFASSALRLAVSSSTLRLESSWAFATAFCVASSSWVHSLKSMASWLLKSSDSGVSWGPITRPLCEKRDRSVGMSNRLHAATMSALSLVVDLDFIWSSWPSGPLTRKRRLPAAMSASSSL